jgi:hypothetical protein
MNAQSHKRTRSLNARYRPLGRAIASAFVVWTLRALGVGALLGSFYFIALQSEGVSPERPSHDLAAETACDQLFRSARRVRQGRRISSSTSSALARAATAAASSQDRQVKDAGWVLQVLLARRDRTGIEFAIREMLEACRLYEGSGKAARTGESIQQE